MFTKEDFRKINKKHFIVVQKTAFYLDLKSRITGHTWSIYSSQIDHVHRSLVIRHKHHDNDEYHVQHRYHPKDVLEAQKMIIAHDEWHISGRKKH